MKALTVILAAVVLTVSLHGPTLASQTTIEEQVLDTTEEVVATTIQALDLIWTPWFLERGLQEPLVNYFTLRPNEQFVSRCADRLTRQQTVISGVTNNAIYCPADQGYVNGMLQNGYIIIPLWPLALMIGGDMWGRGAIPPGNYAPVAMIAHEFSHHIVDEIARQLGVPHPTNPQSELIADCLGGHFMGIFDSLQPLAAEQIDAILIGWGMIGDADASQVSHGTAAERREALSIGYYGGAESEVQCFNTYWPEISVT